MSRPNEHIFHKLGTPLEAYEAQNSRVGPKNKTWQSIKIL